MSSKSNHRARTYFGMQFVTATVSTTLVLLLLGMVVLFVLAARNLSDYMRESVRFSLLLEDEAEPAQLSKLQQQLEALPYVKQVD